MATTSPPIPTTQQNLRVKTLEIRWHDSKPICSCDFQPRPLKRARSATGKEPFTPSDSYKLATSGEDNNIRIWMVYPHITPPSVLAESAKAANNGQPPAPHPPRVEYLSTLSRHTAAVNVVRWSPNGELIASAGDDGMIIIWTPSSTPATVFGAEVSEEAQYEKEYWKPRLSFHCTTMQVYDLAWSPTGEYVIAGSTDNTARIFSAADGKCVRELADHTHYVQGVAWDPMNEFIATQSSDRSVHVHSVSSKQGALEVHAVGKNTKLTVKHSRTPSLPPGSISRPRMGRRDSTTSDAGSTISSSINDFREEVQQMMIQTGPIGPIGGGPGPLTPTASVASTPSVMFPPPPVERAASSRRSSFSSQAPGSPATTFSNRIARSPSPMPPLALPAIRNSPGPASLATAKLYGDESFTNFFRRLTFSPDGALLLTPAGHFEDPSYSKSREEMTPTRRRGRGTTTAGGVDVDPTSSSSVFIYSRANFSRPPIGQIPGFKKASVAVRFSPMLYTLRPGLVGETSSQPQTTQNATPSNSQSQLTAAILPPPGVRAKEVKHIAVQPGKNQQFYSVDLNGPVPSSAEGDGVGTVATAGGSGSMSYTLSSKPPSQAPTPTTTDGFTLPPTLPSTPTTPASAGGFAAAQGGYSFGSATPATNSGGEKSTSSVFALPYRMLFSIATMDTITIHDTQQAGPICLFTKLHYDEFTDMTWSPDGQCLMLSSRDGYCTIVIFDEPMGLHSTQQQGLQLQSIANAHSHPLPHSHSHSSHSGHSGHSHHSHSGHSGFGHHHSSSSSSSSVSGVPQAVPFPTPAPTPGGPLSLAGTPVTVKRPLSPVVSEGQSSPERVAAAPGAGALQSRGLGLQTNGNPVEGEAGGQPVKKKRRVELTKVADLEA